MRGSATDSSRSRNSHIRSPRSVTCAPIGMPSRSLNCAMDLRARVTCGFWPVIFVRSATAPSMILPSRAASPTPVFTTPFTRPGAWCTFAKPNSFWSAGRISARYFCFRRGWILPAVAAGAVVLMALQVLHGLLRVADADGLRDAVLRDRVDTVADAGRLLRLGVHEGHVGDVDGRLDGLDATG